MDEARPVAAEMMVRRGVAQVVERTVRDGEVAGSSPVTPTIMMPAWRNW